MSCCWLQTFLFTLLALLVQSPRTPNLLMKGECPFGQRGRQGQREDGREEVFWKHYTFYPTVKLFVLNEGKKKRLRFFWAGTEICLYMFVCVCAHTRTQSHSCMLSWKNWPLFQVQTSPKDDFHLLCLWVFVNARAHAALIRPIYIKPQNVMFCVCFRTTSSCSLLFDCKLPQFQGFIVIHLGLWCCQASPKSLSQPYFIWPVDCPRKNMKKLAPWLSLSPALISLFLGKPQIFHVSYFFTLH